MSTSFTDEEDTISSIDESDIDDISEEQYTVDEGTWDNARFLSKTHVCEEIVLNPDQVKNYQEIISIWKSGELAAINNSVMGTGKTVVTCALGKKFSCMFVVAPANLECIWIETARKYGCNIIVISYETLSSCIRNKIKHKFLTRYDTKTSPIFNVTDHFRNLVSEGILLVADEFHRIKKKNSRYLAFKALCDYIHSVKDTSESKITLLSGSPFCEKEHPSNTLQMINIIESKDIFKYNKSDKILELTGINELINYCKKVNKELTLEILEENQLTHKNIYQVAFILYVKIVQKRIIASMPSPKINVTLRCYNAYFNMSEEQSKKLNHSITLLKTAISGKNKIKENDLAITTALKNKQINKVSIHVRVAKIILNEKETNKVCIFLDYDEAISLVEEGLKDYNPIIVNGKINKNDRPVIIKKFQEPTTECRLLIFNTSVGCEGIDLDDVHGGFQRYNLVEPSFYILRMHQLTRRFYRVNTKSDSIIYFVYGNCGINETNIINSTCRKTLIMKETLELQVSEGIVFPADHEYIKEKEYLEDKYEMIPMDRILTTEVENVNTSKNIKKVTKTTRLVLESNIINNCFDI